MITKLLESIKDYLHQLSSMNLNQQQSDFFKWKYNNSIDVHCKSYKSNNELKKIVEEFLKYNKLKQKECYYNAFKIVSFDSRIQYIDGFSDIYGIPIEHAWNCFNGIYFDLTREVVLDDNVESCNYTQIIKLNSGEVAHFASKTGIAGSYIGSYYQERVLKK